MGAADSKPDLREQLGVAMNASHLAVVLIAAFGAATLAVLRALKKRRVLPERVPAQCFEPRLVSSY